MALDIFKRIRGKDEDEQDYLELSIDEEPRTPRRIKIIIENLNSYADSDKVQRKIREGDIVLVKIKDLKEKDMDELKRSIARVRKTCEAVGGDIAGISEDWIVATPDFATIERQKPIQIEADE